MGKRFFSLSFLLYVSLCLFGQQQYEALTVDEESIVSRDQLSLFTDYDKGPAERAVGFLFDSTADAGLILDIAAGMVEPSEQTSFINYNEDAAYAREASGIVGIGWKDLGGETLSVSFQTQYFVMPLFGRLIGDEEFEDNRNFGKSSFSVKFFDTLRTGIAINDRKGDFSYEARCDLLKLPESMDHYKASLLGGTVRLFDAGLVALFTKFGLTDKDSAYSSINFLTPFPFLPYVYYDRFQGDDNSYLSATFAATPRSLDILFTPRFRLDDGKLQSTELSLELLAPLLSALGASPTGENGVPLYRNRRSDGSYDFLGSTTLFYRRQFLNRYSGAESDDDIIGLNCSAYFSDLKILSGSKAVNSAAITFEYNVDAGCFDMSLENRINF